MENKKEAVSKERVSFSLANAEEFQLPEQIDRIYFFNPFSVEILRKSTYLMTVDEMMFTDEIDCSDLFGEIVRERIMIFRLGSRQTQAI